jgi:hypothetical protein
LRSGVARGEARIAVNTLLGMVAASRVLRGRNLIVSRREPARRRSGDDLSTLIIRVKRRLNI